MKKYTTFLIMLQIRTAITAATATAVTDAVATATTAAVTTTEQLK